MILQLIIGRLQGILIAAITCEASRESKRLLFWAQITRHGNDDQNLIRKSIKGIDSSTSVYMNLFKMVNKQLLQNLFS